MKKLLMAAAAATGLLLSPKTVAGGNQPAFTVGKNGMIKIAGQEFFIHHFDRKWLSSSQRSNTFKIVKSEGAAPDYRLTAEMPLRNGTAMKVTEEVKAAADGTISYRAEVTAPAPVATSAMTLNTTLPTDLFFGRKILIDGKKEILLPPLYDEKRGFKLFNGEAGEMVIPTADGRLIIRGRLRITLQDDRKWNGQYYSLRLGFTPDNGDLDRAGLKLEIRYAPYRSQTADLRKIMNMGLKDEIANDRRGGWTDQGNQNDLRMLPTGKQRFCGVNFDLIDPARNGGKSCLVMAGPDRSYFPASAEATVNLAPHRWLYLLHALAWAPGKVEEIGKVTVTYRDGSKSVIPVKSNLDVGNWWVPSSRPNGAVVWTGENKSAYVGLYRSAYKIEPKPVKSIRFDTARNSVWGILAVSAADEYIPGPATMPTYIIAGKDWQPMPYRKDIKKGTILDFSNRLDAPAGKYGPVVIRNGRLVFANRPDVPVRFYGMNLCGTAQFLDKPWAERLADRLAATGYNAVRIHHHDNILSLKKDGTSTSLNPEKLDQLEYFIACLKKRGLYITTDMYVSRALAKGEIAEFPNRALDRKSFKALAFVSAEVMTNWETFTRNWMTHVNPYTGLALKDDPALISISLINEDNIAPNSRREPWISEIYLNRFAAWLKERKAAAAPLDRSHPLWPQFLVETYDRGFRQMKKFVRGLGIKTIISDQNMQEQPLLSVMRRQYDYVDNHFYWDHPSFPVTEWRMPSACNNASALARYAHSPARTFPSRLFGQPMMITEFDFARPNFYRAEGAVLTGAYAALQDWDALFHFAYSHSSANVINDDAVQGHFDSSSDIVKALSQRIGIIQFLWGDVKPSAVAFAIPITRIAGKDFNQSYPEQLNQLGLIARIGSVVPASGKLAAPDLPPDLRGFVNIESPVGSLPGKIPVYDASRPEADIFPGMLRDGALKPEWVDPKSGIRRSTTGQIELDQQRQMFKVVTPGCEVMILPEKTGASGKFMKADNRETAAVICAAAVDRRPLTDSQRILLLHLTDTQATKLKFGNRRMTLVENWGTGPLLARKGSADITLTGVTGKAYRLYAVDTAGERLYEVPVTRDAAGHPQFRLNVFGGKEPAMAYELIRQ